MKANKACKKKLKLRQIIKRDCCPLCPNVPYSYTQKGMNKWINKNYTQKCRNRTKDLENYNTYREPISEEWINGRVRNHAAHTFIVSHPILWVWLANYAIPIESTKRLGQIGSYLRIISSRLDQKYAQHP